MAGCIKEIYGGAVSYDPKDDSLLLVWQKRKAPAVAGVHQKLEKIRGGYRVIEWNETNCDIQENKFVEDKYREGKYAFVSDYFRLKALCEYGGIYLDTDVIIYRDFENLLSADFFCGYIYDCALGTAVIGAKKGSGIIKDLIDRYRSDMQGKDIVNNGIVTEYFYECVKGFCLNGKRQSLVTEAGERVEIFPKEAFETGKVVGRSYSLHFADGSWHSNGRKTSYKIKILAAKLPVNVMSIRQHRKANRYMTCDGKYQRWYWKAVKGRTEDK